MHVGGWMNCNALQHLPDSNTLIYYTASLPTCQFKTRSEIYCEQIDSEVSNMRKSNFLYKLHRSCNAPAKHRTLSLIKVLIYLTKNPNYKSQKSNPQPL